MDLFLLNKIASFANDKILSGLMPNVKEEVALIYCIRYDHTKGALAMQVKNNKNTNLTIYISLTNENTVILRFMEGVDIYKSERVLKGSGTMNGDIYNYLVELEKIVQLFDSEFPNYK